MVDAAKAKTAASPADEFYDDAQDDFPAKEDFENRLVAIWPTGKTGTRIGENGQEYPWVETYSMVLDNGTTTLQEVAITGGGDRSDGEPYLVGEAPALAEGIQWSATGVYSRVAPRLTKRLPDGTVDYRPVVGRINRRKNAKKGLADSWSLSKPTEEDRPKIRALESELMAMTQRVRGERQADSDKAAFDE